MSLGAARQLRASGTIRVQRWVLGCEALCWGPARSVPPEPLATAPWSRRWASVPTLTPSPRGRIAWWAPTLGPLSSSLPSNTQNKPVRETRGGPILQTKNRGSDG